MFVTQVNQGHGPGQSAPCDPVLGQGGGSGVEGGEMTSGDPFQPQLFCDALETEA